MDKEHFKDLSKILENKLPVSLLKRDFFTAIIGTSPSKGARSPSLWNSCYKKFKLNAEMVPMDVDLKNLGNLVALLKEIDSFQGGSCAVPHKEQILNHIESVDEKANICRATNCFYKEGSKLIATNTDGDGALLALSEISLKKSLKNSNFLIIGLGGAGKAIAASTAVKQNHGTVYLSNRNKNTLNETYKRLNKISNVEKEIFPPDLSSLNKADIIINATSIGFDGRSDLLCFNPISGCAIDKPLQESIKENLEDSFSKLNKVDTKKVFFDAVYQPAKTVFLLSAEASGHKTLGGLKMNLYQAVLGFLAVNRTYLKKSINFDLVKKQMESI